MTTKYKIVKSEGCLSWGTTVNGQNIYGEYDPMTQEQIDEFVDYLCQKFKEELRESTVSIDDLIVDDLENVSIKSAEKIYYSLYQTALNKLKKAKEDVELAYLEAKHLKKTYLLDDFDGSNTEIDKDLEMNV